VCDEIVDSAECQMLRPYLQWYIARVAIPPSVFRKSAPSGSKEKAIDFLATVVLEPLKDCEPSYYPQWRQANR